MQFTLVVETEEEPDLSWIEAEDSPDNYLTYTLTLEGYPEEERGQEQATVLAILGNVSIPKGLEEADLCGTYYSRESTPKLLREHWTDLRLECLQDLYQRALKEFGGTAPDLGSTMDVVAQGLLGTLTKVKGQPEAQRRLENALCMLAVGL